MHISGIVDSIYTYQTAQTTQDGSTITFCLELVGKGGERQTLSFTAPVDRVFKDCVSAKKKAIERALEVKRGY